MKRVLLTVIVAITLVVSIVSIQAQPDPSKWHVLLGYKMVNTDNTTFAHNTHPNDAFLPRSGVPGSAGTTSLDDKTLNFVELGIGYHYPIYNKIEFSFSSGGLVGGGRNGHQNDNDSRPAANGAFVYSKTTWGIFTDIDLTYRLNNFFLGARGALTGLFIDNGWDRWGKDESVSSKFNTSLSFGPVLGYSWDEFEARIAVLFGGKNVSGALEFRYNF